MISQGGNHSSFIKHEANRVGDPCNVCYQRLKRDEINEKPKSKTIDFITNIMGRHSIEWHIRMGLVSFQATIFHSCIDSPLALKR